MINTDESALICDLAETYNIYDYKSLSPLKIATFCVGLRDDSRIKLKMNGLDVPFETLLLAMMTDCLKFLVWSKTKDAENGLNKPASIVQAILSDESGTKNNVSFDSGLDFEKAKKEILGEGD